MTENDSWSYRSYCDTHSKRAYRTPLAKREMTPSQRALWEKGLALLDKGMSIERVLSRINKAKEVRHV